MRSFLGNWKAHDFLALNPKPLNPLHPKPPGFNEAPHAQLGSNFLGSVATRSKPSVLPLALEKVCAGPGLWTKAERRGYMGIMENKMETIIMENQMEKKMENEMETTIMENQMEKNMENEMEYIGVIYYSSFHFLGYIGRGMLVLDRVFSCGEAWLLGGGGRGGRGGVIMPTCSFDSTVSQASPGSLYGLLCKCSSQNF